MRPRTKIEEPPSDNAGLVGRFEQLVQNVREWIDVELALLKAKAEFTAKSFLLAFVAVFFAVITGGIGIVFFAVGVVIVLTPFLGLVGAYGATASLFLLIAALSCFCAYRTIRNATASAAEAGRRVSV